ncbi:MAG: hypothetical protein QOD61_513 [Solirubrobacteraceae bacterium]|nr:hypothetical protein [Solirubrobacteraceae bacterium]
MPWRAREARRGGGGGRVRRIDAAGRGVWDFVVGDDWRTALGVVVGLGVTALVAQTTVAAWWVLPVVVGALLGRSLWRAAP